LGISGGLAITEVVPNSAAERAGLMVHDIILSVNSHRISCCKLLGSMIEKSQGADMRLEVLRENRTIAVGIKPLIRPTCEEIACAAMVLGEDANQVWQLPNLDLRANVNPVTGETDLLIFGRGVLAKIDSAGRITESSGKEFDLSLNQIAKLSVPYDGGDPASLNKGQLMGILEQALHAAEAELENLEDALLLLESKNSGTLCEFEQLEDEKDRIEANVDNLKLIYEWLKTDGSDESQLRSEEPTDDAEPKDPKQSRGPNVPEHRLFAVA
jgi:hypothetical protein